MSKIGNLFNKFRKKKKNSQDLDEIFSDNFEDSEIVDEFDDSDELQEDILLKEDVSEVQELSKDAFENSAPDLPNDSATREIDISALQLDDHQIPDEEIIDEFSDEEDEFVEEDEVEYQQDPDFDFTMGTGNGFQTEIDLENDKISVKDKLEHLSTRFADRFRNMNKKDLNVALKPPRSDRTGTNTRIKVKTLGTAVKGVHWENLVAEILKQSKRPQIHRYFQYSFTFILIFMLANGFSSLLSVLIFGKSDKSSPPTTPVIIDDKLVVTQDDLNRIRTANVFKTTAVIAEDKPDQKKIDTLTKCTKGNTKSSLPIKLFHTVVLQDSVKSIASVSVRSGAKPSTFREGDKIGSLAKLDRIERLNLVVKNLQTGECESIPSSLQTKSAARPPSLGILSPSASRQYKQQIKQVDGIKNDGNNFEIKKSLLKEKISGDMGALLSQARGIKINNPDGTLSFKIVDIQPGSLYFNLGIQEGDIITQINGEPIDSLNAITSLFSKISNIDKLNLTFSRGGEPVTQNYNIK